MRPLWLALLVLSTGTLEAQTVRGQLVDSISRAPVAGAFLTLVDERGVERARAITNDAGQFVVTAPAAGTYHVRSKLIGFRPYVSPALALKSGETTTYNAAIDPIPVALKEVVIAGERECDVDSGASVAALWEEVREALAAVAWTSQESGYWYELLHVQRELTAGGKREGPDSTWSEIGYQQVPFKSAPATQLEAQGYVVVTQEGWTYYGPDAGVLLSDPFLRTHCFETKTASGLVGLAFTPVPKRTLPDIKGTLWVDRDNGQLRYLEFSYTRLPERIIDPRAGGRIEFLRVPTGAWIVRDWVIRMPIARIVQMNDGRDAFPQVIGFREAGGSAVEIKSNNGTVVYRAEVAPAPAVAAAVVLPAEPQPLETPPSAPNLTPEAVAPTMLPPTPDTVHARPKRGSGNREELPRDEFEGSTATDAFSLVQQFRPNWLHYRGPLSLADPTAGDLKVYVDGFLFGDVSALHNVPVLEVQRLRHLSGPDATMRYGVGHGGGVIEVWTRRS
jgi:Carboxypeptidase regulatory-like domain